MPGSLAGLASACQGPAPCLGPGAHSAAPLPRSSVCLPVEWVRLLQLCLRAVEDQTK